jgi:hypothetical protein
MAEVNTAVEDAKAMGPAPSTGFGPREVADAFRMSQQKTADDAISDVDMNSVVGRCQASVFVVAAKNYEGNADRRTKASDFMMEILKGRLLGAVPSKE